MCIITLLQCPDYIEGDTLYILHVLEGDYQHRDLHENNVMVYTFPNEVLLYLGKFEVCCMYTRHFMWLMFAFKTNKRKYKK